MKKWIAMIMLVGSMSFLHHEVDAFAQTKHMNMSLVQALKKGKLPNIPVKVATISRMYDYKITKRSIEKYFGKPYKWYNEHNKKVNTYIDKTGTYYTHIRSYKNGSTNVMVGTKKFVSVMKGVKRLSKN